MKTEKEISALVEATLAAVDHINDVPAPEDLKAQILARIQAEGAPVLRPKWLRPALTAAAAIVILAVNILTIRNFNQNQPIDTETSMADPIDEIRSAYALDASDIY